jgi:O-antigen ligase
MADELGAPGLLLWLGLIVNLILLAVRRLRTIVDLELRIELSAVFAVVIAFLLMGVSGPIMASPAAGPFFWFATGIAAYWFLGPGRKAPVALSEDRAPLRPPGAPLDRIAT